MPYNWLNRLFNPEHRKNAEAARKYGENTNALAEQQQKNIDRMWEERNRYSQQAEDLLGQSPTYQTPQEIQDYKNMTYQMGEAYGTGMQDIAGKLSATDYTQAGQDALTSGYGDVVNYANKGAGSLRDYMRQGVQESAEYAKTGMQRGLKDVQGFTDYYRQLAGRQEMPGQRGLEDKLGRSYSEGYKALGQRAGGGASGLGAMIDLYSNKAESLSDIGIQAAQYKSQQESQLGEALQRAQAVNQNIYNQMSQGALSRAGAMAGAEQTATGMETGAAQGRADAMSQYALNRQASAQNQATTQANIFSQGITGQVDMQGAGLLAGAQAADQRYLYNNLMPWQAGMNYYTAQVGSLNPYGASSDFYNSQMNSLTNQAQLFGKNSIYSPGPYTGGSRT